MTDVKRNLHLLRTMNPVVITKDGAELCKWAADMIELMGRSLSVSPDRLLSTIKDHRVREIVDHVEQEVMAS